MADDAHEPESLRCDLSSLYDPPFQVPAALDDAILNRARAELARPRNTLWRLRWVGGAAAAAACLMLIAHVSFYASIAPDDIDANRRVDIVDALKLARQIESGKGRDVNGDGIADKRDVDAVAMVAVRLDAGGVQ